jgi:hypothetical protein
MRSEAMLENHRVRESNGREAAERTPHFAISGACASSAALSPGSPATPDKARWNGGVAL